MGDRRWQRARSSRCCIRRPVFAANANAHHALEGWLPALIHAVGVVKLTRAIEADAEQKLVLPEEATPFLIQRDSIGL